MRDLHLPRTSGLECGAAFDYVLCGWHTRSDLPLTAVPTQPRVGEDVDVRIEIAQGASPLAACTRPYVFKHSAAQSLIKIGEIAEFEVSEGRRIRVWLAPGAARKDAEIFLLGPAWASLCHQRGLLPLHASAIRTAHGLVAFSGHSGAGKSTTAAAMVASGYELVTDDVLPIGLNQDASPGAWPYLRRMKLRSEPIAQLALSPIEVVSTRLDREKKFVRPQFAARDEWVRLERIYLLDSGPGASRIIHRIVGADAVRALVDQTYHFAFVLKSARFRDHLEMCARIAARVPIYRMPRFVGLDMENGLAAVIRAHLDGELVDNSGPQP
jgi:hypothetical protein